MCVSLHAIATFNIDTSSFSYLEIVMFNENQLAFIWMAKWTLSKEISLHRNFINVQCKEHVNFILNKS
jgi:hypothetical protein